MPLNSSADLEPDDGGSMEHGNADMLWLLDFALEPSYISELARKMMDAKVPLGLSIAGPNNTVLIDEDGNPINSEDDIERTCADIGENTAVRLVASMVNILEDSKTVEIETDEVGYDKEGGSVEGESQSIGSPHMAFSGSGLEETKEWRGYKVVHNVKRDPSTAGEHFSDRGLDSIASRVGSYVDPSVGFDDKVQLVRAISSLGNDVSRYAELIVQDVMERQFRHYKRLVSSDYNDPGVDFYVEDSDRREYGLAVEVSVRWVNPIGTPYIEEKENKAIEYDGDLLIVAPRFAEKSLEQYESLEDPQWHDEPVSEIVHLHKVPSDTEEVYRPFAKSAEELVEDDDKRGGNPVIIPDSKKLRDWLSSNGHVGDGYPVVERDMAGFIDKLGVVKRNFNVVTESEYRHMVREAMEPLLWEFLRPYKIEQFLIDTYWDKDLSQSDIGSLIGYGSGTVGEWMRDWGVMRRGTGAPELTNDTKEIWKRMYMGEDPFKEQHSGYRIQAEYNRHPMWDLDDWRDWYNRTTEDERKELVSSTGSYRRGIDYTAMLGPKDRLLPSYTFILTTLKDIGVETRPPDEAPRVPYNAYPSKDALEYMLNRNQDTIVEVSEDK